MGEQDPGIDQRPVREPGDQAAEGRGPVPVEQLAQEAPRRAAVRAPQRGAAGCRPEAALLDQRPGPRPGAALQPAQVRSGHPPGDQQLRPRVGGHPPERGQARAHGSGGLVRGQGQVGRPADALEHQQVQRRVHVDRQPAAGGQVANRDARGLGQPARERVVGREVRQVAEDLARPGDRDDVGGVAVVGEGPPLRGAGRLDQRPAVRRRGEGDGAGAEHDQPVGPELPDQAAEAGAEWGIVGRLPPHDHGRGAGGREALAVVLGERDAGGVEHALERARVGRDLGGEDEDGDRGHAPPSLPTRR